MSSQEYVVLSLTVFIAALGLPLPVTVALAGAGALARQGHLHLSLLFAGCLVAAVLGDTLGYLLGRLLLGAARRPRPAGSLVARWLPAPARRLLARWLSAASRRLLTRKHLGLAVFLTRWAVTAPGSLINLVAGAQRLPFRIFVLSDLAGEALWVVLSLAPGFLLGGTGGLGVPLALVAGALVSVLGFLIGSHARVVGWLAHL